MKKHFVLLAVLIFLSVSVMAQDDYKGQGYLFVAPGTAVYGSGGGSYGILHFGGGGEGFLYKGLAAGAEIGYVGPTQSYGDGVGLLSVNGGYHFKAPDRKLVPFLTGGYSLAFRSGHLNGANFGGGVTYWAGERYGVRLEFRDNYFPQGSGLHQLGFRVGLSFR